MIRVIVINVTGIYSSIYDEFYTDDESDDRISKYKDDGYICVKITY